MGSDIALVAAAAGHRVLLYDVRPGAAAKAIADQSLQMNKLVGRGKLEPTKAASRLDRLSIAERLDDLEGAALIVEAIVEDMEVKVSLFQQLEAIAPQAILATTTSSLSISALGARLARPQAFAGLHFFNPATVLPLVEVVRGASTDPQVVETLRLTAVAWGKSPVCCESTPGFIVNRVARPFYGEALALLTERATDPATLDAIIKECGGFRMGPCELMDMIGHDVNFAVTRSVFDNFFYDPRYRPSLVQKALVDAGWLGRKSGRGFYLYGDQATPPAPATEPPHPCPPSVDWGASLGPANALADLAADIPGLRGAAGDVIQLADIDLRLTDGRTAAEVTAERGRPTVLFDLAIDYAKASRIAIAAPSGVSVEAVIGLFQRLGKAVSRVDDVPGLIVARTVAMLVNEAAEAALQGVASAADIDLSMVKGVNYPFGPLALGDRLGPPWVVKVLDNLARAYPEGRYRASQLLRRRAFEGRPLREIAV